MPELIEGTCALCRRNGILQDSHFMPSSIYKSIRKSSSRRDMPGLVVADASVGAALTDKQVRKYLLCNQCEKRFSDFGETVMSRLWSRDTGFKLRDRLNGSSTPWGGGEGGFYTPSMVSDVDHAGVMYFVLSVIWRASISGWREYNHDPIQLGPYKDLIGKYLAGQDVIEGVSILVFVDETDEARGIATFPLSSKTAEGVAHMFRIPGMMFYVFVGASSEFFRRQVGFGKDEPPLAYWISAEIENEDLGILKRTLKYKIKPRGRLAKYYS